MDVTKAFFIKNNMKMFLWGEVASGFPVFTICKKNRRKVGAKAFYHLQDD